MAEKQLLTTLTGELYQPVRLHYGLCDKTQLTKIFKRLRCLDYDKSQDRWVWLYAFEAKKLKFQKKYPKIPKHFHPIVIGSFFIRGQEQLLLDLRSFERAIKAIPFFDKYIPRRIAKVIHAEIVNKVFSANDRYLTPDKIFDNNKSTERDPDAYVKSLHDLADQVENVEEKRALVFDRMMKEMKDPFPEIEKFPVNYYEDGIIPLETVFRMRQIIAFKHWQGDTDFNFFDLMSNQDPMRKI
jgi:hypothetical protein